MSNADPPSMEPNWELVQMWLDGLQAAFASPFALGEKRIEAVSLTLDLSQGSGDAASTAKHIQRSAAERGLKTAAILNGHALTIRFTRLPRWGERVA